MRSLLLSLLCAVAFCADLHAQTVLRATPANSAPLAASQGAASAEGAVFRAGDIFDLRMSGMPPDDAQTFAQQFTIGGDGFINIPLGGQIRAVGLTQSQLERAIERALIEQKIFTRPTANINVAPQARFVTIGGQVRSPQRMIWSADLTLNSALTAAGGGSDFAGKQIKLTRAGKVTIILKKDLDKSPEKDVRLLPGDQVEWL